MDRLTKNVPASTFKAVPVKIDLDFAFELDDYTWLGLQEIFDRLADYEDTGLLPPQVRLIKNCIAEVSEEYNTMYEYIVKCLTTYAKAEEEGRLVILPAPAKEGDPKPECFYNDNAGLWCNGMAPNDGDEPTERCKQCWYCENGYAAEEGRE